MPVQRLSTWVALACKEPRFQRFLHVADAQAAADAVRALCRVKSRSEFDRDLQAQALLHQEIRLPYIEYSKTNQE